MFPKPILDLAELLSKLPGIGPRQASRLAFFILRESKGYASALTSAIKNVTERVRPCVQCFRSMDANGNGKDGICDICKDPKRDQQSVCIVEKEIDIPNIEKTKVFHGTYHVLGGGISLLEKDSPERARVEDLYRRVEKLAVDVSPLEIIIATSPTTEGDATALYLERTLEPLAKKSSGVFISRLGRGLSMGAEVEYADEVTLEEALKHRTKSV